MDTFTVVYIKDLCEVEPVPHHWVHENTLFWPPTKRLVRQFQSNAESKPDETWVKYGCIVKEKNIHLFSHASSVAEKFCQESSTEDDEAHERLSTMKFCSKRISEPRKDLSEYNHFFASTSTSTPKKLSKPKQPLQIDSPNPSMNPDPLESTLTPLGALGLNFELSFEQTIEKSMSNLTTNLIEHFEKIVKERFDKLDEAVKSNDQKLVSLLVKQDEIERLIKTNYHEVQEKAKIETEFKNLFPLDSVKEVMDFEGNLNDEGYRTKILKHLKRIHGTGQPWKHVAYKLCAVLFTKKLLTLFSWTGLSRKAHSKEAFRKLVNILDVFHQVVYYSDCTFSHKNKEDFFKDSILKHSQSRFKPMKKKGTVLQEIQNSSLAEIDENVVIEVLQMEASDDNSHDGNIDPLQISNQ